MEYIYHTKIESDPDGGFIANFPDVPEVITAGNDMPETLANAQEALGLALRARYADNEEIPTPGYKEGRPVAPDAWDMIKLSVLEAFRHAGISKTELGRRLGKQEAEARRILDPYHFTKLQTLEKALEALGKQVVVIVQDTSRLAA